MKHSVKEILFGVFLFATASVLSLSMLAGMSGCATTDTTKSLISDDTIKAMTEAVSKLDKDQVRKLETAIKEKLKNETTMEETKEEISKEGNGNTSISNKDNTPESDVLGDAFPLEKLKINVAVDSPQLIRHYTNGWTIENPWSLIKDLPVTVTIKKFDSSGIELEGVPQGKYENDKWERTSCFWAFDENGVELGYEDHAYTSYEQPGKFYGKAKYILVVRCSDSGATFHALARSKVMEVK